jgi:hypothetical protein
LSIGFVVCYVHAGEYTDESFRSTESCRRRRSDALSFQAGRAPFRCLD